MKKGNILLHGIGKILFCMIGSVSIIGEMIVIGNVISKISIFDGFFLFWSMLIVAFVIFLLGTVMLILLGLQILLIIINTIQELKINSN